MFILQTLLQYQFPLPPPHAVMDPTPMQLGRRERYMQERRHDLESKGPPLPQAAEKIHDDSSLEDSTTKGCEGGD